MSSWKSVGGINYNTKNQYIRANQIQVDTIVAVDTIGKKDTTAYVEGDLYFQDGTKLYSVRKEIDSNGLYIHYPFNKFAPDAETGGTFMFLNESQNENIDPSLNNLVINENITIGGSTIQFADKSPQLFYDLSYGNTLHLRPKSVMLHTPEKFNPSAMITNDILADEFKALTMNCWIYIQDPAENDFLNENSNLADPRTGFLLFGLDTPNMENSFTEAVGRNRIDGQIDHLDPSFYFFCPGFGHNCPQFYWTEDVSSSMITGDNRASVKSDVPFVYNSWNMMTLVVRNRKVELYRNGILTDEVSVSGRMPNNKYNMIINGPMFYDYFDNVWKQTSSSLHDVKIIDYKVFNYAVHPDYIILLYKHYSELTNLRSENFSQIHTKAAYNYYIDSSFSILSSTLFVQGDTVSIGKHEVFNKQTVYGPSEIVNDQYISGDLGVGVTDPDEKLHVRGNIKSSGNLFLGFEDISVNGIYFKGYLGDVNPHYKHTAIEERYYIDPADGLMQFPYTDQPSNTELLVFKGNERDINKKNPLEISAIDSITDVSWNNTHGDRIRIKGPNILFDTFDNITDIGDDFERFQENHKMIFDQSGNLGINTLYAKQRLDVRGKINLQSDHRYDISSNIYIANTFDPDPKNKGTFNTGIGGKIFINNDFDSSCNVAVGYSSQKDLIQGFENTSLGYNTLRDNKYGSYNIAIGTQSLEENLQSNNTGVGYQSQMKGYNGENNTSLGHSALRDNVNGKENVAVGFNSMMLSTNEIITDVNGVQTLIESLPYYNTALGAYSLYQNDTSNNTAIGYKSQFTSETGNYNTSLGSCTLENLLDGSNNVAIGYLSMNLKTGSNNVSVGTMSLQDNNNGEDNVSIGYYSMNSTTGDKNIAIGTYALPVTTTDDNVAIGHSSLKKSTDATENVTLGSRTLTENISGSQNVAIGYESQMIYTGAQNSHNTSVGYKTLHSNTDGRFNTSIGHESSMSLQQGNYNTSIGCSSLHKNEASNNNAFGSSALYSNVSGTDNISLGYLSLYSNVDGDRNIGIGNQTLYTCLSNNNIAIGHSSQYNNQNGIHNISLGVDSLRSHVNTTDSIAIGNSSQQNALDASNNISIGSYSLQNTQTNENDNVAIGHESMRYKRNGNRNIALGSHSYRGDSAELFNPLTTGDSNISIGHESMFDVSSNNSIAIGEKNLMNTRKDSNIAIGHESQIVSTDASGNISLGYRTLHKNIIGNRNVAIGYESQHNNVSDFNTSIGYQTLHKNTDGNNNTASGYQSLHSNTTGNSNTSNGFQSLYSNTQGYNNNAYGLKSLYYNTSGNNNSAFGYESQLKNTEGDENTSFGNFSSHENSTGNNNSSFGFNALYTNIKGNENIAIGHSSQFFSQSNYNTSLGNYTLENNTDGSYNTVVGYQSMKANIIGGNNVAMGYNTMVNSLDGSYNIAIGSEALSTGTTLTKHSGTNNIAVGNKSMFNHLDGSDNIAIGTESLYDNSGNYNIALGFKSMHDNEDGSCNIGIGYQSMYNNETGINNISIGMDALYENKTSHYNIAIGENALYNNDTSMNIAIGYHSQYTAQDASSNTTLGNYTLKYNQYGNYNTAIGFKSQMNTDTDTNDTKASHNTSIGFRSLTDNNTGKENIALGSYALENNKDNNYNVAIGYKTLNQTGNNTTGTSRASSNVAIGWQSAMNHIDNGNNLHANISIGYKSLQNPKKSYRNIAIGAESMIDVSGNDGEKSYQNIAVGNDSMKHGQYINNIAIGNKSMERNTTLSSDSVVEHNIAIGNNSMMQIEDAIHNVSLGNNTLQNNISGAKNCAIGHQSLNENKTGNHNIAIGYQSLRDNSDNGFNIGIGTKALFSNGKGSEGYFTSENNIGIGLQSLTKHIEGSGNVYLGNYGGWSDISGQYNTSIGYKSLYYNVDGCGNTVMGYKAGHDCKGDHNIIIGYEADIPGGGHDTTDDGENDFGEHVDRSISIGYKSKVTLTRNIAIGEEATVDYERDSSGDPESNSEDISGSIALGNNTYVSRRRSMAIGVDAQSTRENTIVIGETIPYEFLKPDHATNPSYDTEDKKYNNHGLPRKFDETVKVCIGTTTYTGIDNKDYKFRVDGSANITGDLKVDGNVIFTGDTIQTVDHEIIRMSEQLDISNTGIAPALKITQYGRNEIAGNDYNYSEGEIIAVYDGDKEFDDISNVTVFNIKNGGNTFFRNNVDISRNLVIYNKEVSKNRDPNEIDPSYNHVTINAYPGDYDNHNTTMRNESIPDESVHLDIQETYTNRPEKYLPRNSGLSESGKDYKQYDFAGGRDGTGQYTLEVSGNVFVHNYMKIETNRPFENSLEIHTTDGIQLPCGSTSERPGNYYYHANNPDANINESIYPSKSDNRSYEVNNFTGNSSDGSIRYNTDTSQCEVYTSGNMWTGLAGYRTEQAPYLKKYDLGQSKVSDGPPILHNTKMLSVFKSSRFIDTAWKKTPVVHYDAFTGLPYPLYHYTIIDIQTEQGWQLFKVLNGNVNSNGNETEPDISYSFTGKLNVNDFTTLRLTDLPDYPEKPTIDSNITTTTVPKKNVGENSVDVPIYENGFFNLDADISYNVRVYTLNKSRTLPKIIHLKNLFLLREAYPNVVSFAFNDYGTSVAGSDYYPFNYLKYNVKMNLDFKRTFLEESSNDNRIKSDNSDFDDNVSYPSIEQYEVLAIATDTKCMGGGGNLGSGKKNNSITVFNNILRNSNNNLYGATGADQLQTSILSDLRPDKGDLEQTDVSFQVILLPGTKYKFKLKALNNRNPYYSNRNTTPTGGPARDNDGNINYDEIGTPYIPNANSEGEYGVYREMPYFTNIDNYTPTSGSHPSYIKYIENTDISFANSDDWSKQINFGGHRTVTVFDPTSTNNYKNIPYYNEYSDANPTDGFPAGSTGQQFDISGEEHFFVNFNQQGANVIGNNLATASFYINSINLQTTYAGDNTNFITSSSNVNSVITFNNTIEEAAIDDINKGFVEKVKYEINAANDKIIDTDYSNLIQSRNLYEFWYKIESIVNRNSNGDKGFLDAGLSQLSGGVTTISSEDRKYQFYIDDYNDATITTNNVSGSINVNTDNIVYLYGIPSCKKVTLQVDYDLENYADQFLPAVEVINNSGEDKTLVSKVSINTTNNLIQFGGQQSNSLDDEKKFIGIDETYNNNSYEDINSITATWNDIYLKDTYVAKNDTSMEYQITGFHINNSPSSNFNNVGLISNHSTDITPTTSHFVPQNILWSDRNSFQKDGFGLIDSPNAEVLNVYYSTTYNDTFIISETVYDVAANDFSIHNRELIYIDGKFISSYHGTNSFPHWDVYNGSPFDGLDNTSNASVPDNTEELINGVPITWNSNGQNVNSVSNALSFKQNPTPQQAGELDDFVGQTIKMKFVIFKIPPTQHLDTGFTDISNLKINDKSLDEDIGIDGVWNYPGVFVWIAQKKDGNSVHNSNNNPWHFGSVNKLFDPTETNWYLNENNKTKLSDSYNSEAAARSIDNANHVKFNNDFPDGVYLIVGLDNAIDNYINFLI